jgi:hypothetical protein
MAVHVTALEPKHLPAVQESTLVQALPSSQPVPSMRGVALQAPVLPSQTPTLQASSSPVQLTVAPATHVNVPRLQVSTPLQALPSLQSPSLAQPHLLWSKLQPEGSWQLSTVQVMPSLHATVPPPQTPLVHLSALVQALLSLQGVASGLAGFEHVPVAASHVPALWHWSLAEHTIGFEPVQLPPWQVSVCVHRLPSTHAVPSCLAGLVHLPVPATHVPAVWH